MSEQGTTEAAGPGKGQAAGRATASIAGPAGADAAGQTARQTAGQPYAFTAENEAKFQRIIQRYPDKFTALMPTLWLCHDQWGWMRPGLPEWVAGRLDVPLVRVYELLTFYTMFYLENPGRYNLQVCRNVSCHLMGARRIIDHLRARLGVEPGQTDREGLFRLEEAECLGACGYGPMMLVGKDYYENLTIERVDRLIEQWRRGG